MRKMMSQGHEYKKQWRAIHADQLAAYVKVVKSRCEGSLLLPSPARGQPDPGLVFSIYSLFFILIFISSFSHLSTGRLTGLQKESELTPANNRGSLRRFSRVVWEFLQQWAVHVAGTRRTRESGSSWSFESLGIAATLADFSYAVGFYAGESSCKKMELWLRFATSTTWRISATVSSFCINTHTSHFTDQLAAYVNFCHDTHFSEPDERSNKRKTTVVPITGNRHRPAGSLAPM